MADKDAKMGALQQQGTLNPRPKDVRDDLFLQDNFFDPRDLVQVKYEMLRRVQTEGQSVTDASANFGFSRPSFYQALSAFEEDGLAGLVPHKRGPKQAHKLTEEVLTFIGEMRQKEPSVRLSDLVKLIQERFGIRRFIHEASNAVCCVIKKNSADRRPGSPHPHDLVAHYEQLRRDAMAPCPTSGEGLGLALFLRRGMTAWMQAWSECAPHGEPSPRSQPGIDETIPVDMRPQITTLLASMILCLQQEATL